MVRNDEFRALARPELEAVVVERRSEIDRLEADWLSMVAALHAKRAEDASVAESTTSWLARACRLGYREAAGKVALARSLAAMPLTATAVAAGEISVSEARVLARAHRTHPSSEGPDRVRRVSTPEQRFDPWSGPARRLSSPYICSCWASTRDCR